MNSVTAYGDSILKGVINTDGHFSVSKDSFVHLCEEAMGIKVNNRARFGSTITLGERVFERSYDALAASDDKYVVFKFGGNDCDHDWKQVSDNPHICIGPKTDMDTFTEAYKRMIDKVQRLGRQPVLLSLPPIDSVKYFDWISRDLNRENILSFLEGNVRYLEYWHESYNLEIFKLAQSSGVPVVDISTPFLKLRNYSHLLCMDGIHPNEAGHKLIADTICSVFC